MSAGRPLRRLRYWQDSRDSPKSSEMNYKRSAKFAPRRDGSAGRTILKHRIVAAALAAASMALQPASAAHAHDYSIGDLRIAHPWSRATPPSAKVGGGYLRIENKVSMPDRLVSATMELAGRAEIHEMSLTDGVMRMHELPAGVAIAPGGTVELKPGGLHVMVMDLAAPLKQGERRAGALTFERAGTVAIEFTVEAIGAAPPAHGH